MTPLIIGIDHGYASIKTANFVFPSGVVAFDAPPPVQQGLLEFEGRFFVCGSGSRSQRTRPQTRAISCSPLRHWRRKYACAQAKTKPRWS